MRPISALLFIFFGCLIISSCQKEFLDPGIDSQTPTTPPVDTSVTPPAPHDSVTLLSRLIFMTSANSSDTSYSHEYGYDDFHRVTSIKFYNYISGSPDLQETISYFYQGNDSLPYKKLDIDIDPAFNETTYFFYNVDKSLARDSLIFPDGTQLDKYIYTPGSVTDSAVIYYNADPGTPVHLVAEGTLDNNQNVTRTITQGDNVDLAINTFSYDNNPNPFDQLNIRSTYNPIPGFDFYLYDNYLLKHNVTVSTEEEVIAQGPKVSTHYDYTYNTSGLPTSVILTSDYPVVSPGEAHIFFEYKKF